MSMLPENAESTILNKLKQRHPGDSDTPEPPSEQHGGLANPADNRADAGYDHESRVGMQHLLQAGGVVH
jgi:hypothetical protein